MYKAVKADPEGLCQLSSLPNILIYAFLDFDCFNVYRLLKINPVIFQNCNLAGARPFGGSPKLVTNSLENGRREAIW